MARSCAQGFDFPLDAWNFRSVFMVVKLIIVQDSALQDSPVISLQGCAKEPLCNPLIMVKDSPSCQFQTPVHCLFPPHRKAHSLVSAHMKINCTGYEYKKRNWVLRLFCDRATVCMVPLSSVVFSGSRTYFRDRNWGNVSSL